MNYESPHAQVKKQKWPRFLWHTFEQRVLLTSVCDPENCNNLDSRVFALG